jgi:hypothetical protein
MPIAASEKVRSRLERLHASTQAIREMIRAPFLEHVAAIIETQRGIEQDLRDCLREGMERQALLDTLAAVRSEAERATRSLETVLQVFEGDPAAVPTVEAQLCATADFLAWVCGLQDRFSAPIPPFDEAGLLPAPDGPKAEGYISVSEARARAGVGKKP